MRLGFAVSVTAVLSAGGVAAAGLPTGELIEEVVCQHDADMSYALYLPTGYGPERAWPILYALDASTRGPERGTRPVKLYRNVAERFGYIVASSNNSAANVGFQVILDAMQAMWRDTHARLAIDEQRVYATGMSGTARGALWLAEAAPGSFAGVIACAAGFDPARPPREGLPFSVYGIAGNTDFNYQELQMLDETLLELGLPHRVESFEGPHGWPPEEAAAQAIEWMEIRAMEEGRRARDEALIRQAYERELHRAAADESDGQVFEAFKRYRDAARDYGRLLDVSRAAESEGRLGASKALREARKRREKLRRREQDYNRRASTALAGIREEEASRSLGRVLSNLEIRKLKKRAAGEDRDESLSARRLLARVFIHTAFYVPRELRRRGDHAREALSRAVAAEIEPERAGVWYNLACARSLAGDEKGALKALRRAVDTGFRDLDLLRTDEDLEPLRGEKAFEAIVAELAG